MSRNKKFSHRPQKNNKTKLIISSAAVIVVLLSVWLIHGAIQKVHEANRVPFLRVTAQSKGGWLWSATDYYFIVYDNGDVEETDKFQTSDIQSYYIQQYADGSYKYDGSDMSDAPLYTTEIIKFVESMEHSQVYDMFIVDGRYFFDVYNTSVKSVKYRSVLYEYLPDECKAIRIAGIENYYIKHVELYSEVK